MSQSKQDQDRLTEEDRERIEKARSRRHRGKRARQVNRQEYFEFQARLKKSLGTTNTFEDEA